jgi:hypothetical protein
MFYLFCPNSPLQTLILFSLHPGGSLRLLGGLVDLEQPLGELLPMGPLLEKWSKVIGVSSLIVQTQTVTPPPHAVRPLATVRKRSDR